MMLAEVCMSFAEWVENARLARRMTKIECADRAGVSLPVWIEYENKGKKAQPRRATVLKIAAALGVSEKDALEAAGYAAPQQLLRQFPHAHSISSGNDILASRVGGEVIPASKMERARKMIEDGQKSINDGLRLLEQAKEELEEG